MPKNIKNAFEEYDRLQKDERWDSDDEAIFDKYALELHAVEDKLLFKFFDMHGLPQNISERCIKWDWEQREIDWMIEYLRKKGGY